MERLVVLWFGKDPVSFVEKHQDDALKRFDKVLNNVSIGSGP